MIDLPVLNSTIPPYLSPTLLYVFSVLFFWTVWRELAQTQPFRYAPCPQVLSSFPSLEWIEGETCFVLPLGHILTRFFSILRHHLTTTLLQQPPGALHFPAPSTPPHMPPTLVHQPCRFTSFNCAWKDPAAPASMICSHHNSRSPFILADDKVLICVSNMRGNGSKMKGGRRFWLEKVRQFLVI